MVAQCVNLCMLHFSHRTCGALIGLDMYSNCSSTVGSSCQNMILNCAPGKHCNISCTEGGDNECDGTTFNAQVRHVLYMWEYVIVGVLQNASSLNLYCEGSSACSSATVNMTGIQGPIFLHAFDENSAGTEKPFSNIEFHKANGLYVENLCRSCSYIHLLTVSTSCVKHDMSFSSICEAWLDPDCAVNVYCGIFTHGCVMLHHVVLAL